MTEREHGVPSASGGYARLHQSAPPTPPGAFAYRTVESPLGDLLVARTAAGIVRVAFAREGFARVIHELTDKLAPCPQPARSSLDDAARAIDRYFSGRMKSVPVRIDLQLAVGFGRAVAEYLPSIEYGSTASYAEVAAALGRPGSAHAVGVACRSNPIPILLPCHRAVRSDGRLGDYVGGPEAKRVLLALEAV